MSMQWNKPFAAVALCLWAMSTTALAADFPSAAESDPARLGWMVGSPPPEERMIRFEDGSYFQFPAMRWSVANFRQLMPTVNISRGLSAPGSLDDRLDEGIDDLTFTPTPMPTSGRMQRRVIHFPNPMAIAARTPTMNFYKRCSLKASTARLSTIVQLTPMLWAGCWPA